MRMPFMGAVIKHDLLR